MYLHFSGKIRGWHNGKSLSFKLGPGVGQGGKKIKSSSGKPSGRLGTQ
jgi:hypothetical protein